METGDCHFLIPISHFLFLQHPNVPVEGFEPALRQGIYFLVFLPGGITLIETGDEVVLELVERAPALATKLNVLLIMIPSIPLGDVGRHRDGCSSHLTPKTILLLLRETLHNGINSSANLSADLPSLNICKMLYRPISPHFLTPSQLLFPTSQFLFNKFAQDVDDVDADKMPPCSLAPPLSRSPF